MIRVLPLDAKHETIYAYAVKDEVTQKPDQGSQKQTHKYFADQYDDEEVLLVFRKHPVVMRKGLVLASLGPLVGILPAAIKTELGLNWFFGGLALGFVLSIILFFPSWLHWYYSIFIVTDQRLIQITQKGMFDRSVVDIVLNQIQMVNYQIKGVQETLLGFGTIMIQTYVGDLIIHDVHHPAKIQKELLQILRKLGITAASSLPNAKPNVQDQDDEEEN